MEGSNRGFVTDTDHLSFIEKMSNGTEKFTKLNEKLLSNHWGFQFWANDFIFKAFNRKIKQLVEAGVVDVIIKNESRFNDLNVENHGPVMLTLDHLGTWFIIWLAFLAVSSVSFLLEAAVSTLMKLTRKINHRPARKVQKRRRITEAQSNILKFYTHRNKQESSTENR